jgi:hypothetical protein
VAERNGRKVMFPADSFSPSEKDEDAVERRLERRAISISTLTGASCDVLASIGRRRGRPTRSGPGRDPGGFSIDQFAGRIRGRPL